MTPPYEARDFIADTSAWTRAQNENVRDDWQGALTEGQIWTTPIVVLELLAGARSGREYDAIEDGTAALRTIPVNSALISAAQSGWRDLAYKGAGYHTMTFPDVLIAAAAQDRGVGVLHYDRHFDRLAEVFEFESRWVAPAGSIGEPKT